MGARAVEEQQLGIARSMLAQEDVGVHEIAQGSALRAEKQGDGQDGRVKGSNSGQEEVALPPGARQPEVRQQRIGVRHLHDSAVALAGAEIRALHDMLEKGPVGGPGQPDGRQNPVLDDVPPCARPELFKRNQTRRDRVPETVPVPGGDPLLICGGERQNPAHRHPRGIGDGRRQRGHEMGRERRRQGGQETALGDSPALLTTP